MKEIVDQPVVEDKPRIAGMAGVDYAGGAVPGADAQSGGDTMEKAEQALSMAYDELSSEEEESGSPGGPSGPMSANASDAAMEDPMLSSGNRATESSESLANGADPEAPMDGDVEITEDEKTRFLDSVVLCKRYEAPFSLFGGRMKGVLRSRRSVEGEAIDSYMKHLVREDLIRTNTEYTNTIRTCLLVACVKELNGVEHPEMMPCGESGKVRLDYSSGKAVMPEWVERLGYWESLPESVVAALMAEVALFEAKYWTMTRKAKDENFWSTGGSTGA